MGKSGYATEIVALYQTSSPYTPLNSCVLLESSLCKIQEAVRELRAGDRIVMRLLSDASRQKFPGYPDTAPVAIIEIETEEQRIAWKAKRAAKLGGVIGTLPAPAEATPSSQVLTPESEQGEFDY